MKQHYCAILELRQCQKYIFTILYYNKDHESAITNGTIICTGFSETDRGYPRLWRLVTALFTIRYYFNKVRKSAISDVGNICILLFWNMSHISSMWTAVKGQFTIFYYIYEDCKFLILDGTNILTWFFCTVLLTVTILYYNYKDCKSVILGTRNIHPQFSVEQIVEIFSISESRNSPIYYILQHLQR